MDIYISFLWMLTSYTPLPQFTILILLFGDMRRTRASLLPFCLCPRHDDILNLYM
jgi:hypothetical protein